LGWYEKVKNEYGFIDLVANQNPFLTFEKKKRLK
jgi:hypothetical protein